MRRTKSTQRLLYVIGMTIVGALSYLGCLIFIDSILCSLLQVWNVRIVQAVLVLLYVALAQDHVGGGTAGTSPGAVSWQVIVDDL